jgi:hypothetical protein
MRDVHRQLCRLLTQHSGVANAELFDPDSDSDESFWIEFVDLANINLVTPAIWPELQRNRLTGSAPANFQDYFSTAFELNDARNLVIQRELAQMLEALNARSIVPVLLKGAAYIKDQTYADAGARMLGDLDILVARDQTDTAVQVLRSLGYSPAGRPGRDYDEHHHTEPLRKPGCQAYVEIHREAIAAPLTSVLPASRILRDADAREEGYAVPSATHSATISFLHSQVIDRCDATARINIRSLMDIARLDAQYGDEIDWGGILESMTANGLATPLRNYFYSLEKLGGLDFSGQLPASLRQKAHHCLINASLRFGWLETLMTFLNELSARQIAERYKLAETGESLLSARFHHISHVAKRAVGAKADETS